MHATSSTLPLPQVPGRQSVYGHRGAQSLEVENTAAALHAGFSKGDGVELDVQLTRDGQLVVFHDTTTGRLTGGNPDWAIKDKTLAELQRLDLGGGARILTLKEALEIFEQYPGKLLNIEIKGAKPSTQTDPASAHLGKRVAEALRGQSANWDRMVISSFDPAAIEGFRSSNSRIPCSLLYEPSSAPFYGDSFSNTQDDLGFVARRAKEIGAQGVNPKFILINEQSLASLAREGIPASSVITWTVPTADEAHRLDQLGVGAVIVNDPQMIPGLSAGSASAEKLWR